MFRVTEYAALMTVDGSEILSQQNNVARPEKSTEVREVDRRS